MRNSQKCRLGPRHKNVFELEDVINSRDLFQIIK